LASILIPSTGLPAPIIPPPTGLPRPSLDAPKADLPSFKPMLVPAKVLISPPGTTTDEEDKEAARPKPKEVQKVDIPWTNYRMPVPEEEIMITAATTAAISVAATLTATSLFKQCVKVFKPIIMQLAKRIQKKFTKNGDTTTEESSE
tara:strand:- start:154 stop:594 length:441 start_codon:yes stop_codon:yes gene_type:complete